MGSFLRPIGGKEHEERADDLDSSQGLRDHLVTHHLAPAITDFILDENRECCNNDLELTQAETLTLLHSKWSKEIEPSRQNSTNHSLIMITLSATQLTRKARSSCVEACGGKHPRCWNICTWPWTPSWARNASSDRKELVHGPRDSSMWFRQNPRLVAGMRRASGRNKNHHDERSAYMPGPRTMVDNR